MEGHEHSDWSTYYAEPEVRTFNVYFCVKSRSRFIQLNISPEIILTLRSNIDLRRLQILPHLDAQNCPYKVMFDREEKPYFPFTIHLFRLNISS